LQLFVGIGQANPEKPFQTLATTVYWSTHMSKETHQETILNKAKEHGERYNWLWATDFDRKVLDLAPERDFKKKREICNSWAEHIIGLE